MNTRPLLALVLQFTFLAPTMITTALSVAMPVVAVRVQVRHVEEPCLREVMPGWPTYAQRVGRFVPCVGRIGH